MNNEIGIVLIHGAGLNSSIWNTLVNKLSNPILSIDFPNRKQGDKVNLKLTFDDYVDEVVQQIKHWDNKKFIVVGHSIGACVGLEVAHHFQQELQGFLALGSVIPSNGKSFTDSLPFPQKLLLPIILKLFGTKPPQKSIEHELCNDLSAEQTLQIVNQFTPESIKLYTTRIDTTIPNIKVTYIKLTNDKSLSCDMQDKMAQNLHTDTIITLESGHLPMMSKPQQLATIVANFIDTIK